MTAPLGLMMATGLQPSPILLSASPSLAVLLGTLGLALIFLELNRPGSILPGAMGLLLLLAGAGSLLRQPLRPAAVGGLLACCGLLLCNVWRSLPWPLLALAATGTVPALRFLVREVSGAHAGVAWGAAVASALLVGVPATVLSRIAYRARRAKAVH